MTTYFHAEEESKYKLQRTTHFDSIHHETMSHNTAPSFLTLPIELVYRILDNLDIREMILSTRNVCQRLDAITESYHPYQVNLNFFAFEWNHFTGL